MQVVGRRRKLLAYRAVGQAYRAVKIAGRIEGIIFAENEPLRVFCNDLHVLSGRARIMQDHVVGLHLRILALHEGERGRGVRNPGWRGIAFGLIAEDRRQCSIAVSAVPGGGKPPAGDIEQTNHRAGQRNG